jgi:undecaprenyl-diphosphatase
MVSPSLKEVFRTKNWVVPVLVLLVLYVILPQLGSFKASAHLLKGAEPGFVGLAVCFAFVTYAAAAATYLFLAFKPLSYGRTILIELAGMFVNRLLPAGLGNIGVNYLYLRKQRHTGVQASSVVAVNNTLGFIGHALLLALLLLTEQVPRKFTRPNIDGTLLILLLFLVVIALGFLLKRFSHKTRLAIKAFIKQIGMYRSRPLNLLAALLSSLSLTLANTSALYLCSQAIGLDVNFLTVFIVFTAGLTLGTATPTPGGLGGIEAGMVAGFVAYHFSSAQALAVVLLYRLITYWVALVVGAVAFIYVQRRSYI